MAEAAPETVRIQVYLARCGVASRRACDKLVAQGRVTVDGRQVPLGTKLAGNEIVCVDRRRVHPVVQRLYLALNKPARYLCSATDRFGRPLASELFEGRVAGRIFHAGRLDFLSSGLIFYTNDGDFARIVTHPACGIEKDYRVDAYDVIPAALLESFREGIQVQAELFSIKRYVQINPRAAVLTLNEGKNREIRKIFAAKSVRIRTIHRVRIGTVALAGLDSGCFRSLTKREVSWFLQRHTRHRID